MYFCMFIFFFFFSSRRRHTRYWRDWSSDVCSSDLFYSEVHRIIYGAMTRLYSRGEPIDQLTLTNELRSIGEFEKVGGRAYVFQIVESVPTAANAARYAEIVRGKALLREIIDVDRKSEEHTSELQSRQYLVCRLLLEKIKTWPGPT